MCVLIMRKFEKQIAKNSKYIDSQISKFTSAIRETENAIELHNETINSLNHEKEELDRLIVISESEKDRASKFLDSIKSFIN